MKNTSTNPFYASAKVERGDARLRVFKALREEECEVVVRREGDREGDREVYIGFSDRYELALADIILDTQEAKEFANMILGVAEAIEREGRSNA